MAKERFLLPFGFDDDDGYRNWGSTISAKFGLCGFAKTADTGQVDWTVAVRPGGTNQTPHYEIWQFTDALQATKPVFIKVIYGLGDYTTTGTIFIQVATATNGTGGLSGLIGRQRRIVYGYSSYYTNQFSNIFSGGEGNRMAMFLFFDTQWFGNYVYGGFIIERTRNADGTVNGNGVATFFWHYPNGNNESRSHTNQVIEFDSLIPSVWNDQPAALNVLENGQDATFYNGKVSVISVYPVKQGSLMFNPLLGVLGCLSRDFVDDITTQIDYYGATRTYLKVGYGGEMFKFNLNQNQRERTRMLILWE